MPAISIDTIVETIEKDFGKPLVIKSSKRTSLQQAKAMFSHCEDKYHNKSSNLSSYANHKIDWVNEIYDSYLKGKILNERVDQIIQRMNIVILQQVKSNKLISNHLIDTARDIQTKNFLAEDLKKLKSILLKQGNIVLVDETGTSQPHYHIHLK